MIHEIMWTEGTNVSYISVHLTQYYTEESRAHLDNVVKAVSTWGHCSMLRSGLGYNSFAKEQYTTNKNDGSTVAYISLSLSWLIHHM